MAPKVSTDDPGVTPQSDPTMIRESPQNDQKVIRKLQETCENVTPKSSKTCKTVTGIFPKTGDRKCSNVFLYFLYKSITPNVGWRGLGIYTYTFFPKYEAERNKGFLPYGHTLLRDTARWSPYNCLSCIFGVDAGVILWPRPMSMRCPFFHYFRGKNRDVCRRKFDAVKDMFCWTL